MSGGGPTGFAFGSSVVSLSFGPPFGQPQRVNLHFLCLAVKAHLETVRQKLPQHNHLLFERGPWGGRCSDDRPVIRIDQRRPAENLVGG
jgi:hypothetical protein